MYKFNIGDEVFDKEAHVTGTIKERYINLWTIRKNIFPVNKEQWLLYQEYPFTEQEMNLENWYCIHSTTDRVLFTCESRLKKI